MPRLAAAQASLRTLRFLRPLMTNRRALGLRTAQKAIRFLFMLVPASLFRFDTSRWPRPVR
jgi:hypothetical protein